MGGNIGFGWSRKTCVNTKKWNFYRLNKKSAIKQPIRLPSDFINSTQNARPANEKTSFSPEENVVKITKDVAFTPVKDDVSDISDEEFFQSISVLKYL